MKKKFRIKDVIQDEVAECGLACISYISGVYGKKISLDKLRNKYDVNLDGLSFFHLMKICADNQMIATGVSIAADALGELEKPAILLWDNCHFVVLKRVGRKRIEVMDPATGSRYFTSEETLKYFSGVALEIVPADNFSTEEQGNISEKKTQNFFSMQAFFNGLIKYKSYMLPLAAMAIIIQLTNVAVPKFMSLVFDEVLPGNDEDLLFLLIYIFSFIYLAQSVSSYLKIIISQRLRRAVSQFEGVNTVNKLFQMDLKFFNKRMPSDLLRKIKSVDVFHVIFTHGWLDIAVDAFFSCVFIVLLFMISFELAMLTVAVTGSMVLVRVMLLSTLMSRQYSALDSEVRRDNSLLESIDNINMIKISHTEHRKVGDWFYHHAELEDNRSGIEKINALIQLSITTISHIQTLIIMGVGAWGVLKGNNTAGQLISFIFYKNCLMNNIQAMVENHVNLKICSVEVRRLQDISPEAVLPVEQFSSCATRKREPVEKIAVKDLAFTYSNLDDAFIKNVNFSLNAGEKLVLTGPSGCGKSTVLNIAAGLLKPTSGKMLVNGMSLGKFGQHQYQEQISLVTPDDKIINGSITENIIYESEHIDMQLLEKCIDDANLGQVIFSLSAGLNTRLGVNGAKLSSGQQQRLMLARALYRKPALILLDEPTSHLDDRSKQSMIELIKKLPMACLIVSHDQCLITAIEKEVKIGTE
ncbi:ATP-binding cassette domain-containing protein [Erwinia psidii]|uniref:peptidase domain-containing ABC transporter n=1 Tax=Erwinia psidii TaxID=69224 RepID=UPI00226BA42B|nr:ATP-binding cassette domain-containing protein [Erwinia psidii]MCX8960088.1 ATP-binding cassette domain-containing protein [Erwinia psidii]